MSTVFRLDASIRDQGSVTRAIATTLDTALVAEIGDATIVRRDVGVTPLPSTAWGPAVFGRYTPEDKRNAEQVAGIALAGELADELVSADAYIFAVPLYNFGVSQHVKAWVDLVITDPRFAAGAPQILAGRPAYLVTAHGGGYAEGTPRHGWDHATPWLVRIFRDVWGLDLQVIESELTLADSVPAMEALRGMAAENLKKAHADAKSHGVSLAERLRAVVAA